MTSSNHPHATPKQLARRFWNQATGGQKDVLAEELFYEELETVRRPRPLLDPATCETTSVQIVYENQQGAAPPTGSGDGTSAAAAQRARKATQTSIDLTTGGEPPDQETNDPDAEYHRLMPSVARSNMKYHLTSANPGQWPSPGAGLRFAVERFKRDLGWTEDFDETFAQELEVGERDPYSHAGGPFGYEDMLGPGQPWLEATSCGWPRLAAGFPLVEGVRFVRHTNAWPGIPSGTCYWTATAMLVYGDPWQWLRVKVEHQEHFARVLANPAHPQHALYRALNEKWYATTATGPRVSAQVAVNLWQALSLPGCYTPVAMADVTADLYNVYVVMFSYDSMDHPKAVYETRIRGAYNARHLFYLYLVSCRRHIPPPPLPFSRRAKHAPPAYPGWGGPEDRC